MKYYTLVMCLFLAACSQPDVPKPQPQKTGPTAQEIEAERLRQEQLAWQKFMETKRAENAARERLEAEQKRLADEKAAAGERETKARALALEQQKKLFMEKAAQELKLREKFDVLCVDRAAVINTANQVLATIKRKMKSAEYEVEQYKQTLAGFDNRMRGRQVLLDQQQALLASVPVDFQWGCVNVVCPFYGRASNYERHTCIKCGMAMQQRDINEGKRITILAQIKKHETALAMDRANKAKAENAGAPTLEKLRKTAAVIEVIRTSLVEQEQSDIEHQKVNIDAFQQDVANKKTYLSQFEVITPKVADDTNDAPKKVYKLKNGSEISVLTEMVAGDDIVIKTVDGKMITVNKKEIAQ